MTDSSCLLASTNEWSQHNSDIGRDSRSRMCDVTCVPEAKSERRTMHYKKKESELNHPHFVAVRLSDMELHLLLQQDLADKLAKEGVTISYKAISNWERNLAEPSVTIFYKVCRILGITNMYEAYFGVNPADPFSSLTDEGREKAMDYINLLHASGMYEKQTAKIIPFRSIDIFENAVSAGTGNFLVDEPKETVCIDESILP